MKKTDVPVFKQTVRELTINFSCPAAVRLDRIDSWLASAFGVEVVPSPVSLFGQVPEDVARVAGLLWRCLMLSRELLQAVKVPVFDIGAVKQLVPDGTQAANWKAVLLLAEIENIPRQCHALAFEASFQTIFWLMEHEQSKESREHLFEMTGDAVKKIGSQVAGGSSTIPLLRTAYDRDIPFVHLGAGVYQLGWGSHARRMDRSAMAGDSFIGVKMAQNKIWASGLVRMAGLPSPVHGLADNEQHAMSLAQKLGWPVVVKPKDRDRGEGVVVGIINPQQLKEAFAIARRSSKTGHVIVEREVPGVCHRFFIVKGRLLYATRRLPKSVRGNGRDTVRSLIEKANLDEQEKPIWHREIFPSDALAMAAMTAAGFSLESIPGDGHWVPLRKIESTEWGGRFEDVTAMVHTENVQIALLAAELFGLKVAGVDIISPDICVPWHENGAIINEVNFAPLLGGTDISRAYLPEFFDRYLSGDSRIPIEVFLGGEAAMSLAVSRQSELVDNGTNCFLTSHEVTFEPSGRKRMFPSQGLYTRCRALLLDQMVDAILLVVHTDELLQTGLPFDRISDLKIIDSQVIRQKTLVPLPSNRFQHLESVLKSHLSPF